MPATPTSISITYSSIVTTIGTDAQMDDIVAALRDAAKAAS